MVLCLKKEIVEVFTPIDPSEVSAGLSPNDVAVFSYGLEFLDYEVSEQSRFSEQRH